MPDRRSAWPALDYAAWRDTGATLHRWTQIVGKVRLALTPWLNHGWHVTFQVTARGLGSSAIHVGGGVFELEFDFVDHRLVLRTSSGPERGFALAPMSVAEFYRRLMAELAAAGIDVAIDEMPNEIADPIAFPDDTVHAAYDRAAVNSCWRALVQVDRVLHLFRTSFLGKASPVHFFWGAFDLAVTRFSGRAAPLHPGGIAGLPDAVTREAYSHEVSSAGFWPGNDAFPHAAFYCYAYPAPVGFAAAHIEPAGARWSQEMGEWLLPYEIVRAAADPDAVALRFLESTYRAAADLARWDPALDCAIGAVRRPRPVG
ncbi:MAG: DUF5996 family protein [Pseudomonadota bacterium]|nr:DUF5996 family protein [Pseudomonadota bacterium]